MNIFIDIETIPDQRAFARDAFIDDARENFRAPSTMTKEQAASDLGIIDAKEVKFTSKESLLEMWADRFKAEKAEEVGDAAWRKTSFDGGAGSIICIGMAVDDMPAMSITSSSPIDAPWSDVKTEADMLRDFFAALRSVFNPNARRPVFIGHNHVAFDLRFIWQRAIVLGVEPPMWLPRNARPWDAESVFDTMTQWAGVGNRISMDNLCAALGIPGKGGDIDGSKVWDYVKSGRINEVAAYCRADVERTREIFKRMTFQRAA